MLKIHELREQRSAIFAKVTEADTANDHDAYTTAMAELVEHDKKLTRAEAIDAEERREVGRPLTTRGGEFDRELRNYSISNAISGALEGRLTGREAEIDQELKRGREARSGAGIHIAVPSEILLGIPERRDGQIVSSDPAGGYTVGTQMAALGDRFRPALKVEAMGATVMRGLTSFLELPNLVSSGTAKWIGENQNVQRSAVGFNSISMGPRTVSGEYRLSRRLMLQNGVAIEGVLRRDLGSLLATSLDSAAINGDGVVAPLGILQTPGVTKVAAVGSGGLGTDFIGTSADMIAELELDDVTGSAAFLTNPLVMKWVRKRLDGDAHKFSVAEQFHNQRVEVTTQVPKNIGTGSDKSALIYGLWSELYLGYWSAVDILINPYHPDVASNGGALLHAFLDADVAVRHPEAFVYSEI